MYTVPNWLAQNILSEANRLKQMKILLFIVEATGVYLAQWTTTGIGITRKLSMTELEYYRITFFADKNHLALRVRLPNYSLYIGMWTPPDQIQRLTTKYLMQYNQEQSGFNIEDEQKEIHDGICD